MTVGTFRHTLAGIVDTGPRSLQIHATCVEVSGSGVVLLGGSGDGKSDLALRLIDAGAVLVADDRTDLHVEGGRLIASPPPALAGRMEVRGVGILSFDHRARSALALAVDLAPGARVERLPDPRTASWLGVRVPRIALAPFEASAPAKVRLAVREARRRTLFAA